MSSHRPRSTFPLIGGLVNLVPGGRRHARVAATALVALVVVIVAIGVSRGRHVAEFAPASVIDSREPLQELPVRAAAAGEAVEPAHTYDAIVDLSNLNAIVVGVDLDYVMKGLPRYDAVIRTPEGGERFRGRIQEADFKEGRFLLRLFAKRFPAGDYTLDIEGFDAGATEGRIIASSWFQVTRE